MSNNFCPGSQTHVDFIDADGNGLCRQCGGRFPVSDIFDTWLITHTAPDPSDDDRRTIILNCESIAKQAASIANGTYADTDWVSILTSIQRLASEAKQCCWAIEKRE